MGSDGSLRKVTAPPTCARKLLEPGRMLLKHPDDGGMSDECVALRPFAGGAAEECAGLERGTVRRKLEQGRARTRAHDLNEAEAVHGRPLEGLRQDCVDSRRRSLAAAPFPQGSADRCRSIRRCRDEGSPGQPPRPLPWPVLPGASARQRRSGSLPASARPAAHLLGSGRCRSAPPRAGRTIPPARADPREREKAGLLRPSSNACPGASSVIRASGRFHGSVPGIASRVTSMLS